MVPLIYELKKMEIYDHFCILFSFYRECLFLFFLTVDFMARATGGLNGHTHSTTDGFQIASSPALARFFLLDTN